MSGTAGGRGWKRTGLALLAVGVLAGAGAGVLAMAETEEARLAKMHEAAARQAFDEGLPETFVELQALSKGQGPDGGRLFSTARPHIEAFYGGRNPAQFQGDLNPAQVAKFIQGSKDLFQLGRATQWTITPSALENIGTLLTSKRPLDAERDQLLGAINMHRSMADLHLAMNHPDAALTLLQRGLDVARAYRLRPFASCQLASLMAAHAIARDVGRVGRSASRDVALDAEVEKTLSRIQDDFLKTSDTRGSLWLALAWVQLRSRPSLFVDPSFSISPGPEDARGRAMAFRLLKMARDFRTAEHEILTDKAPQHGDIISFVRSNKVPDSSEDWLAPLRKEASQQLRLLAELRQLLMDLRMSMGLPPKS